MHRYIRISFWGPVHLCQISVYLGAICILFVACKRYPVANQASGQSEYTEAIISDISRLKGVYVACGSEGVYCFDHLSALDSILTLFPNQDSLVQILFDHLDDASMTESVFSDKKLLAGNMAYQALTLLVYFEPTDPTGDILPGWGGHIKPYAEIEALRRAKDAWREVISTKSYIFL